MGDNINRGLVLRVEVCCFFLIKSYGNISNKRKVNDLYWDILYKWRKYDDSLEFGLDLVRLGFFLLIFIYVLSK